MAAIGGFRTGYSSRKLRRNFSLLLITLLSLPALVRAQGLHVPISRLDRQLMPETYYRARLRARSYPRPADENELMLCAKACV